MFEDDNDREYTVVRNDEGQHSIWPVSHDLPAGWEPVGRSGVKSDCLAYIRQVWADMRPKSLREQMDR
jgi:MbtH protein